MKKPRFTNTQLKLICRQLKALGYEAKAYQPNQWVVIRKGLVDIWAESLNPKKTDLMPIRLLVKGTEPVSYDQVGDLPFLPYCPPAIISNTGFTNQAKILAKEFHSRLFTWDQKKGKLKEVPLY